MTKKMNIGKAKNSFSELTEEVKAGEVFMVCERNVPFAEIRPLAVAPQPEGPRPMGLLDGWFEVPADFNEPIDDEEDGFDQTAIFPAKR